MKLEKRFEQVQNLLKKHQSLIELEVMERYPKIESPYDGWVEAMIPLQQQDLIQIENLNVEKFSLPEAYLGLISEIVDLMDLPKSSVKPGEIPKPHLKKMTYKKRHEISLLLNQLAPYDHYIDVGSGAGHLSGVLLDNNEKTSLCIDQDARIQAIGKQKFSNLADRLIFETGTFKRDYPLSKKGEQALIGLHSCGDLSVSLIDFFIQNELSHLFNYGCCYHKLTEFNLSMNADLSLTNHALTMAAKSYKKMTEREFVKREKVKRFRYTLHFIMVDHLTSDFQSVGNAKTEDYNRNFSDYCHKYCELTRGLSADLLEQYFHDYQTQYERYLRYGIIRSHLSRVVEIYLILDRALYLKERGFNVEVEEVFDRSLSPRNLCLKAHAKEA